MGRVMEPIDDLQMLLGELEADPVRAERVFRSYERFLRRVARRRLTPALRRRFDSADVVQSVWATLLRGGASDREFTTPEHLRAFLARAVRNRVIDRARRARDVAAAEQRVTKSPPHLPTPVNAPRPSEQAGANELWERMLAVCPPEHRPVLNLRRQGFTLDEVAASTGLHEGSVRRILRTLARRVAFDGGANPGGRS
jgi:RNA polymerase sigma-70 factor (ECF subfamily)